MSGIRSKDTRGELVLRSALHRRGFRFLLHRRDLPGTPDVVFPRYGAVLFFHGCFWHGHGCSLFRLPKTRPDFWREKIAANVERDRVVFAQLMNFGWRVAEIWECSMKGAGKLEIEIVIDLCEDWLRSESLYLTVRGES